VTDRTPLAVVILALAAGALALSGCSPKTIAVNALGNALASDASSWGRDDDPDLVRDATPFALKTIEGLIQESPKHEGLLLAAASGFTQYSYAFVESDADYVEARDLATATALRARARRLYRRAREYGMRGLEVDHPGFGAALRADPAKALASVRSKADVPLLYWTAAPWALEISLSKENAELTADLPTTAMMVQRAVELDEGFGGGALYDFLIAYDGGRPASAGGSVERARADFEKALAFANGTRVAPYVGFAETVCVATQNRTEFARLLKEALAVDPNRAPNQRLANLIAQRRARWLIGRADELFIE
jgi:predicted anti-sigma-YlaC factor YlaD